MCMRHFSASAVLQSLIVYYIMVLLHVMMCNLVMYKQPGKWHEGQAIT